MKIIIESHVPFVGDAFSGIAEAVFLPPEEITRQSVTGADALVVRTRTRCDRGLLEGTGVRFVATATIGTDHIDLDYCRRNGIMVVSAPGCNAPAVAQYVWSSVLRLRGGSPRNLKIGIVGLGHVGSIVADWGRRLGAEILACDPPRELSHGGWNPDAPFESGDEKFLPLETLAAEADVITFHTPHTAGGAYPTHHLADEGFFASLRRQPVIINAARGPIIDTETLLRAVRASQVSECVIDCWEGEPAVSANLMAVAAIATPHIAGYSAEGKRRATAAAVGAALRFFARDVRGEMAETIARRIESLEASVPPAIPSGIEITPEAILGSYNPLADTAAMKTSFTPALFERLRNSYPLRHELGF